MQQSPSTEQDENAANAPPLLEEADIGSGEKTLAQLETDELIRQIPPLPHARTDVETDGQTTGKTTGKTTAAPGKGA